MKDKWIVWVWVSVLFAACGSDASKSSALTMDEAASESTQYAHCSAANPPCSDGMQCYQSMFGLLCLPDDKTACHLFGCTDRCTLDSHSLSDGGDAEWTAYEVTTCLEHLPDTQSSPCNGAQEILAIHCEEPNVALDAFDCSLCVSRAEACTLMGCSTDNCGVATITWDGDNSFGEYLVFANCLEADSADDGDNSPVFVPSAR